MPINKLRSGLDEQILEGGGAGAGMMAASRSSARGANEKRLEQKISEMSEKERAALENPGKQFENLSPLEAKTMRSSARGANEKRLEQKISEMSEKERAALENPGKQFETLSPGEAKAMEKVRERRQAEKKSLFEMTDKEVNALTPAQRRKLGSDVTFKKGGMTASARADGCATKGKTRGKMV